MNLDQQAHRLTRTLGKLAFVALASLLSVAALAQSKLTIAPANVSASSSDTNLPANANDGSLTTRWSADATGGAQWLQYKLGGCYNVTSLNLAWYNGDSRRYNFHLQTSVDGSTWTDSFVGSNSGTSAALKPYDIPDVSAQYVRVLGTGSDVNSWVSLLELEVYTNGAGSCGLNPGLPPGGNFNLAPWTLQLPTGSSGNIDTVSGSTLAAGYTKQYYFYTDSADGAMVMMDPAVGWTTSGSLHPRTEMRENAIWTTGGTNLLDGTVKVTQVPSTTTIAQIFQGTGPSKPLCELEVSSSGTVKLFLENTNQGGGGTTTTVGTVPIGTKFTYQLKLSGSTITVTVNGTPSTFTMDSSFNGESFYFKAGDYDQSAVSGTPQTTPGTVVKYYALKISH
ncbi:MAG: polysaccharide lyase family 7 protein [Pseudomonadota bacterium]